MPRQLSNSKSAVKARKYRENKAAKLAALVDTFEKNDLSNKNAVSPEIVDTSTDIELDITPNESPKPSLKERLFGVSPTGGLKPKAAKKGQRGKQIDASLMSKVLPTMIAGSIALYAKKLVKDPYKPCAPTQQEVMGTIGPLFSILSRRIEIVGTASEDMIDLITALLTSIVTGIRMHITYLTIQEEVERAKHYDGHVNASSAYQPSGNTTSNAVARPETQFNPSREVDLSTGVIANKSTDASNGNADTADGDNLDAKREAAAVASLFKRDISGRTKLGLLAR